MTNLIALFALCTPLNVIDGYQNKGRFVRELIIWKMQSQGHRLRFAACFARISRPPACWDRVSLQKVEVVLVNRQEMCARSPTHFSRSVHFGDFFTQ